MITGTPDIGRVLVTGASGFVGARIVACLIEHGYEVRAVSRRAQNSESGVVWLIGDITDTSACERMVAGCDVVINAAGEKNDPVRMTSVNEHGTANLVAASVAAGVRRFIQISSVGVIGAAPWQRVVFNEESPCAPRGAYERSKLAGEGHVRSVGGTRLSVAILRPANVFGDRDPRNGLLTLIRRVRTRKFAFLGGREAICNYVYVDDVAAACQATIAGRAGANNGIFHLADSCTVGDFVDTIADVLEVKRPRVEVPRPLATASRYGVAYASRLSASSTLARLNSLTNQACFASGRLRDEFGFAFPVGWSAGLRRTIAWYQSVGAI